MFELQILIIRKIIIAEIFLNIISIKTTNDLVSHFYSTEIELYSRKGGGITVLRKFCS